MTLLVPALCAGAAAAVVMGLPGPRRPIPGKAPGVETPGVLALSPRMTTPSEERRPFDARVPATALALVVGLGLLVPVGPTGAAVAAVLAALARRFVAARRARAQRDAERLGAAEALSVLAAELRAGRGPDEALYQAADVAVGPTQSALRGAAATARFGGTPDEVLALHAGVSAVPDMLRGLAACWQVCQGTGSSLAAAVDRLEEALRAERVRQDVVEAELAGPRTTAALLAGLPAFGILMAAGLGAHPLHVLLHTLVGGVCLVLGVALDLLGLWWTSRIVAAAGGAR